MAMSVIEIIAKMDDFDKLESLEENILRSDALTPEVEQALRAKYSILGRALVASRTGLDLDDLTPAEERIVEATARYVGLQKREGKTANRTFQMLANRGLIETAEISVSKTKPTQGYVVLEDADLKALSFEQIIVDFPDEFSPRALWFARKTLGLPNESEKPPASEKLITQIRTDKLLAWYQSRLADRAGILAGHSNADVGFILGFTDLTKHGRVLGNITSRIDFACYKAGLPPLGLTAKHPFANAWNQQNRSWSFPVKTMADTAQSRRWTRDDLEAVLDRVADLPGQASIPWKKELAEREGAVREWAFALVPAEEIAPPPAISPALASEITKIADLERKAMHDTPEAKLKTGLVIERGPMGSAVKKANGYKCQICEAMGLHPHAFIKSNGVPYVEAHHVTPVSERQIGSLAASNILTVCANHHRQLHFGTVKVAILETEFAIVIDEQAITIRRFSAF
jgi:hypothetical protein